MILEDKVYDFTSYLKLHDKYMDIRSWCGTDMTEAFKTKAEMGIDHKNSTYDMLLSYYIGDLVLITNTATSKNTTTTTLQNSISQSTSDNSSSSTLTTLADNADSSPKVKAKNPYNFFVPFLGSVIPFLIHWKLTRTSYAKKYKVLSLLGFKFVWNSVLVLSLIPSAIFGLYLVFQYTFPALRNVNFDFLYWHVEGSILFSTVIVLHFIYRLNIYFAQLKGSFCDQRYKG